MEGFFVYNNHVLCYIYWEINYLLLKSIIMGCGCKKKKTAQQTVKITDEQIKEQIKVVINKYNKTK